MSRPLYDVNGNPIGLVTKVDDVDRVFIPYEKCRACQYVCRCCSSHFMEGWPQCARCNNSKIEFEPAAHIKYCPLDGSSIK